ncbi:MAG TPA: chemotaxis protein CheA [Burkholderiales bacterium]|nr:chemotaxis protein CheA [Burkholderiales bacterium]
MNEFIEQFLLESRELVEQATDDLLVLEKAPADRERLDNAFRAFHTLKGGAGIVDFAAMEMAVHAAEDVLAAARSGSRPVTTRLIGDCLACLDQVVRWLDSMQGSGELPTDADMEARTLVERFLPSPAGAKSPGPLKRGSMPGNWASALLTKHSSVRAQAKTAIRYAPDPDCFFRSEDPVARIAALPGLLCLDLEPAVPWPTLDALDPFACNLVLTALSQGSVTEIVSTLGEAIDQCDVQALAHVRGTESVPLLQRTRAVLEAQISLLGEKEVQGIRGRVASAGLVAANVLRHLGRTAGADHIARATDRSLAESAPSVLRETIETTLNEVFPPVPAAASPQILHDRGARTLRVDATRIDALVNLTSELTVAKNAIGHTAKLAQDGSNALASVLKDRHAVLDRLVGELQRSVLGMRVLPLRHVFQRFPRLVRDISADLGKPANLIIEGDDTEADKVIVEMLFEPLLHVLRNAMDHGVEHASVRAAQGKPPAGTIRLRAARQGDHVVVEVSDDGRGVDVARVRQVALERNVAPDEILDAMSDTEAIDLIFAPGFSTATKVTDVSGRGVGLDAVRTAVGRLAGHVGVESRTGEGTKVRLTLPFSVMMTRVMTVEAGGQMFGIPLDAIVETVRVGMDSIVPVGGAKAIVFRNRTMPLVELAGALGVKREENKDTEATVVVARIEGHFGALQVDRLGEQMEVMLKPLDGILSGMPGIAGSTLLGDGGVLLVLDLGELLQ